MRARRCLGHQGDQQDLGDLGNLGRLFVLLYLASLGLRCQSLVCPFPLWLQAGQQAQARRLYWVLEFHGYPWCLEVHSVHVNQEVQESLWVLLSQKIPGAQLPLGDLRNLEVLGLLSHLLSLEVLGNQEGQYLQQCQFFHFHLCFLGNPCHQLAHLFLFVL